VTPREHEDGTRYEPTLSAAEKADGFAAVMKRLKSHNPAERARLETQAEAVALGHEAYALGQEYLDRGDFETARRWLLMAAGHQIPGAEAALEEITLRQAFDGFTDVAAAGGDHAAAGTVSCETIPSPRGPRAKDGQQRLGGLAWTSFVDQLNLKQVMAAARQQAERITAQARREADAILAEAQQQAEHTAAACAHIVLNTEQERAEAAEWVAKARQQAEGLQAAYAEMMLMAEQDRREAAEVLTETRQLAESVRSEAVEIGEEARRRSREMLAEAREEALLIIDDARKGAAQLRDRARQQVSRPGTAHAPSGSDLVGRMEEIFKLVGCIGTPVSYPADGIYPDVVERSARMLPVPARPGQNALARLSRVPLSETGVLLVEGESDSYILRLVRTSQERDGSGPGSWSGSWRVLGIGCVSSAAFERADRACGDVMAVRQDQVPILAIGVMKSSGGSGDDAELDVDEARNPTSR
jgi:F0F1-type ATP synthase membrane subunit b/b'